MPPAATDTGMTRVIWNPNANKGRCGKTWPAIEARLTKVLGPLNAHTTAARGDGIRLAREAFAQGCRRFVVVGGDGTLNEVVNGLMTGDRLASPDIVFAQIPAGTSNAVSRAMGHDGLGAGADAAFAALTSPATRPIDLFRADSRTADGAEAVRYGFLLATIGAPATIGLRAAAVPLLKRLGPFAYVLTAFVTALTYGPQDVRVSLDGGEVRSDRMWGAMLCSLAGAGEGILLAPGAAMDDGKIDLVTVGALSRREALLEVLPKLGDGSYCAHPKVARHLLQQVEIETSLRTPVDVDGEPIGFAPLRVRMLGEQMRVAVAV